MDVVSAFCASADFHSFPTTNVNVIRVLRRRNHEIGIVPKLRPPWPIFRRAPRKHRAELTETAARMMIDWRTCRE